MKITKAFVYIELDYDMFYFLIKEVFYRVFYINIVQFLDCGEVGL